MARVVVPLSGGLDSAVVLADALATGHECQPLFINYGHASAAKEVAAAKGFVDWARRGSQRLGGRCHPLAELRFPLAAVARSSVLGTGRTHGPTHPRAEYVPFRNAFLGLVAVNFAVDHRASEIRLGFHKPYPGGTVGKDQMPSFVAALNRLVTVSIEEDSLPVFLAPFQSFTKTGIARRGRSLGVPFELVWTCYTSEDKPCGACSPCGALKQALDGALEGA